MHRLTAPSLLLLGLSLAGSLILPPASALAHEHRHVGKYELGVGFIAEPPLEGEPNGIDLTVLDENQQPVEGLEKTLKATVAQGGGPATELPLRARFRMPGKYTADFVPTRSGTYVFTFSGEINGQPLNERFESGPGRFDDVRKAAFVPTADPSNAELAQALAEARQQAATANSLAMAGLGAGLLGLLLSGYLLATRRRATGPTASRAETALAGGSRVD